MPKQREKERERDGKKSRPINTPTWTIAFVASIAAVEFAVTTKRFVQAQVPISASKSSGQITPFRAQTTESYPSPSVKVTSKRLEGWKAERREKLFKILLYELYEVELGIKKRDLGWDSRLHRFRHDSQLYDRNICWSRCTDCWHNAIPVCHCTLDSTSRLDFSHHQTKFHQGWGVGYIMQSQQMI